MWNFLRGGATFIPGATSISESRVSELYLDRIGICYYIAHVTTTALN